MLSIKQKTRIKEGLYHSLHAPIYLLSDEKRGTDEKSEVRKLFIALPALTYFIIQAPINVLYVLVSYFILNVKLKTLDRSQPWNHPQWSVYSKQCFH